MNDEVLNHPRSLATRHPLFYGTDGLRAVWSLLIYFTLLACIVFSARVLTMKLHPPSSAQHKVAGPHEQSPRAALLGESIPFAAVALVTWIMSRIERRPIGSYGFGGRRRAAHFFAGLGWGVAFLSLLVLTLKTIGLLVFDRRLLFGSGILHYAAIWIVGFLLVALFEEYFLRGYLQYTLSRGFAGLFEMANISHQQALGFWSAALLLSFIFGLGHGSNPGESPIGLISAGLAGLVFCFSLWRTGSLWWAIGFHATWDWAQSFLYGVADSGTMVQGHLFATHPLGRPLLSGGATGPEGSILIVPVMALIAVVIFVTLRQQPVPSYRLYSSPEEL